MNDSSGKLAASRMRAGLAPPRMGQTPLTPNYFLWCPHERTRDAADVDRDRCLPWWVFTAFHNTMSLGIAYAAALGALIVIDAIWLSSMKRFYRHEMGALMRSKPQIPPAAAFYLVYPAVIVFLCLSPETASVVTAFWRGAALGLAAYGTYNMTNLSVVVGWPLRLSLIDWCWGTVLTGLSAAVASWVVR